MKKKLRVGLLVDDYRVPAWAHLMLSKIANSEYADIVLVVLNAATPNGPDIAENRPSRWTKIPSILLNRVLRFARGILMERVQCERNAFEKVDSEPLLRNIPALKIYPVRKTFSDYFTDEDITKIQRFDVDVLVRLGFRVLRGRILAASRHGVWSYHHGDNRINRGGPPGFWETMESWPATGTVLQVLTEDLDAGTALYRSWSSTNNRSVTLNNNARFWTSASFLPRTLRRLHSVGEEEFFAEVRKNNSHPDFYCNRFYRNPDNRELFVLLAKKTWQRIQARLRRQFYFDQWLLLYAMGNDISGSFRHFKNILPPRDRFWADPFVVHEGESYYIFIEELVYQRGKGHISVITMDGQGNYGAPALVIDEQHHLSYPFVFNYQGSQYMLVEACEAQVVPLYRCEVFPHKWVFERNLLHGVTAVDATLFQYGGKWYLFAGVEENPGSSTWDELNLYFADDPITGNWQPHPLNPVISDVRRARPAGRIFERNGVIYRPSQDSSRHYGYGLKINQITKLSETEYEEEVVSSIEPQWSHKITSIHTFAHTHGLTVVDAEIRRGKYW
ncbi:MAG: hypothetical protein WD795_05425 [Woeseia sp.]